MSKIVFFNVPTQGHINATLPVTAELVRRGAEVVYYLTENYRHKIEATGAVFRAYQHIPPDYFERAGLDGGNPALTARTLATTCLDQLSEILAVVEAEKPDIIMYDSMCPWGWLAAQKTGIPSVSSMSLLVLSIPMLIKSGMFPKLMLATIKSANDIFAFQRIARQIYAKYGVALPAFVDFLNTNGTITINYTSALFQPSSERLDQHIKFVGPSIELRPHDTEFPFNQLSGSPLVYISLGTVINENIAFYRACIAALGRQDVQVVMSIGDKIDPSAIDPVPFNFIVRRFVPQLEVLQKATMFITHAGMNSVQEALHYDVPLILVPQQDEQRLVAKRVQELCAGLMLKNSIPNAEQLREAVKRILDNNVFRERATVIGASLRSAGGHHRAADEILSLLNI